MWNQTLQWMGFSELWFVSRALRDSEFQRRNGPLVNALQILQTVLLARGQSSRLVMVLYTKGTAEYEWPVCVCTTKHVRLWSGGQWTCVFTNVRVWTTSGFERTTSANCHSPLCRNHICRRRPCIYCGRGQVLAQSSVCITVLQKPASVLIPVLLQPIRYGKIWLSGIYAICPITANYI